MQLWVYTFISLSKWQIGNITIVAKVKVITVIVNFRYLKYDVATYSVKVNQKLHQKLSYTHALISWSLTVGIISLHCHLVRHG